MKNFRQTLVMMAGLPGSGKTTLAYALANALGWRVIDKDKHRLRLLNQGIDEEDAAKRAYERSFTEIQSELINEQTSVIFDTAALQPFIIYNVKQISESMKDVQLKVILCVVDREERDHRLRTRTFQHTRIFVEPSTIADYLQYFDHLPVNKLILFTNVSLDECLSIAKQYIED